MDGLLLPGQASFFSPRGRMSVQLTGILLPLPPDGPISLTRFERKGFAYPALQEFK